MESLSSDDVRSSLGILQSSPKRTAYEDLLGLPERRRKDLGAPASSATTSTIPAASEHSDTYDVSSRKSEGSNLASFEEFIDIDGFVRNGPDGDVFSGGHASAKTSSSLGLNPALDNDGGSGIPEVGGRHASAKPPGLPDPDSFENTVKREFSLSGGSNVGGGQSSATPGQPPGLSMHAKSESASMFHSGANVFGDFSDMFKPVASLGSVMVGGGHTSAKAKTELSDITGEF